MRNQDCLERANIHRKKGGEFNMASEMSIAISVVIPIFNEAENLQELYRRLTRVMEGLNKDYEIVFIDDGSKDKSFSIIKDFHSRDKRIKAIKFNRNFGHHIALTAGIDYASGDHLVLMDGNLQDPPEEIHNLLEKVKDGYDIVYAIRAARDDVLLKKLNSRLFYKIFNMIGNVEIPLNSGIYMVINRRVADYIKGCREKSRFILALINWAGFSSVGVKTKEMKGTPAGLNMTPLNLSG